MPDLELKERLPWLALLGAILSLNIIYYVPAGAGTASFFGVYEGTVYLFNIVHLNHGWFGFAFAISGIAILWKSELRWLGVTLIVVGAILFVSDYTDLQQPGGGSLFNNPAGSFISMIMGWLSGLGLYKLVEP